MCRHYSRGAGVARVTKGLGWNALWNYNCDAGTLGLPHHAGSRPFAES